MLRCMTYADVNGIRLHYIDEGPRDAPVIVLGHGLLFSTWMWHNQVEALKGEFRCIALDWRGQGRTPASADGKADMDSLTDDLVGLIDHLGLEKVHYAGLSMGGFVGLRFAARYPERVRSLILLDTSAGPEDSEKIPQYRLLAKVYRILGIGAVRSKVEPIMFDPSLVASGGSKALSDPWIAQLKKVKRAGMVRAILGVTDRPSVEHELGNIQAPTLIVVGEHDVATPVAKSEKLAAGITNSRLEIIPGCGHLSTLEKPEIVNELMVNFLAE